MSRRGDFQIRAWVDGQPEGYISCSNAPSVSEGRRVIRELNDRQRQTGGHGHFAEVGTLADRLRWYTLR